MEKSDAGYDGRELREDSDLREEGSVRFSVAKLSRFFVTSGIVAQVYRNGEPVGIVRVQSEEEYLHVKQALTGRMEDVKAEGDSE